MPPILLNLKRYSTVGERDMTNLKQDLVYLERWFRRVQPAEPVLWRWLYLTPSQRMERLRELMLPLGEKKS